MMVRAGLGWGVDEDVALWRWVEGSEEGWGGGLIGGREGGLQCQITNIRVLSCLCEIWAW